MDADEIDYVNVHGTANPMNDLAEIRGLQKLFGARSPRVAVSGTKPVTGHPLAAAGALEAAICSLALARSEIPPTLNCRNPHPECELDLVRDVARPYPIKTAACLNSGLGGKNSCLILCRYPQ